jgi:hypothetical protein
MIVAWILHRFVPMESTTPCADLLAPILQEGNKMTATIETQHRGVALGRGQSLGQCALICQHRLGAASLTVVGPISHMQPPRGRWGMVSSDEQRTN